MPITRRALLASLAAVAGTVAARGAAIAAPALPAASMAPLVNHLRREHQWAVEGLLRAVATADFSPWDAGEEQDKPCRWRLARSVIAAREMDATTPLEQTLKAELLRLWDELACQNSSRLFRKSRT